MDQTEGGGAAAAPLVPGDVVPGDSGWSVFVSNKALQQREAQEMKQLEDGMQQLTSNQIMGCMHQFLWINNNGYNPTKNLCSCWNSCIFWTKMLRFRDSGVAS